MYELDKQQVIEIEGMLTLLRTEVHETDIHYGL